MTPKTLAKERREKFITIICDSMVGRMAATYSIGRMEVEEWEGELQKLAALLAEAAASRSEQVPVTSIQNAIFTDEPVTEEMVEVESIRHNATRMFEAALSFSKPLPWWQGKDWTAFGEWVCAEYAKSSTSFGEYNIWRNTPYTKGGIANTRIRGFVNEFYDSWDMFMMSRKDVKSTDTKGRVSQETLGERDL